MWTFKLGLNSRLGVWVQHPGAQFPPARVDQIDFPVKPIADGKKIFREKISQIQLWQKVESGDLFCWAYENHGFVS